MPPPHPNPLGLQSTLRHVFDDPEVLKRALTTNGYANEYNQGRRKEEYIPSQEALCTLGDAVLKLALIHELMDDGMVSAGKITEEKATRESRENLAVLARRFRVGEYILLGKGEREDQQLQNNLNTLAETMEAIIGAIYLDVGFMATRRIIARWKGV